MKPINRFLGSGVVMSLLLATSASADVQRQHYTVKGDALSAAWHWSDGCTFTAVSMWGAEQVAHATGGQPEYATAVGVDITQINWCTHDFVSMLGESSTGLDINGTNSATIDATIALTGEHCGPINSGRYGCEEASETVSLTAAFTGTGETFGGRTTSSWSVGRRHGINRYSGRHREASVTGNLLFGGSEVLVGDAFARLEHVTTGTQQITTHYNAP